MNEVSMTILKQERDKVKNQIYALNRKVKLLEWFMSDFPNAEVEEVLGFTTFIDHTNFAYETILDKMKMKRSGWCYKVLDN